MSTHLDPLEAKLTSKPSAYAGPIVIERLNNTIVPDNLSRRKNTLGMNIDEEIRSAVKNFLGGSDAISERALNWIDNSGYFTSKNVEVFVNLCAETGIPENRQTTFAGFVFTRSWTAFKSSCPKVPLELMTTFLFESTSAKMLTYVDISNYEGGSGSLIDSKPLILSGTLDVADTVIASGSRLSRVAIDAPLLTKAEFSSCYHLFDLRITGEKVHTLVLRGCIKLKLHGQLHLSPYVLQNISLIWSETLSKPPLLFAERFPLFLTANIKEQPDLEDLEKALSDILSEAGLNFEDIPKEKKQLWLNSASASLKFANPPPESASTLLEKEKQYSIKEARDYLEQTTVGNIEPYSLHTVADAKRAHKIRVLSKGPDCKEPEELEAEMVLRAGTEPTHYVLALMRLLDVEPLNSINEWAFYQCLMNKAKTAAQDFLPLYVARLTMYTETSDSVEFIKESVQGSALFRKILFDSIPEHFEIILQTYQNLPPSARTMDVAVELLSTVEPSKKNLDHLYVALCQSKGEQGKNAFCVLVLRVLRNLLFFPEKELVDQILSLHSICYEETYEAIKTLSYIGAPYASYLILELFKIHHRAVEKGNHAKQQAVAIALLQFEFSTLMKNFAIQLGWALSSKARGETSGGGAAATITKPRSSTMPAAPLIKEYGKLEWAILYIDNQIEGYHSQKEDAAYRTQEPVRTQQIGEFMELMADVDNSKQGIDGIDKLIKGANKIISECKGQSVLGKIFAGIRTVLKILQHPKTPVPSMGLTATELKKNRGIDSLRAGLIEFEEIKEQEDPSKRKHTTERDATIKSIRAELDAIAIDPGKGPKEIYALCVKERKKFLLPTFASFFSGSVLVRILDAKIEEFKELFGDELTD